MNSNNNEPKIKKILIVDDHDGIHEDFKLIFNTVFNNEDELDELLEAVLDEQGPPPTNNDYQFELDSAQQGNQAVGMVDEAHKNNNPYSVIFMDVRMPPGLNGVETIRKIWDNHPDMDIVLCTAYSDYSWEEIIKVLGYSHHLLILKKPYDRLEVIQQTLSLIMKAEEIKSYKERIKELEQHS